MLCKTTRELCLGLAATLLSAGLASAQCAGYPQPTVAYSPVVAQPAIAAQQPLVLQQTAQLNDGWYPGKFLGRVITAPFRAVDRLLTPTAPIVQPVAQPTFVTAAYRPTFPPNYSYATYAAAPAIQTVARPVTLMATPGLPATAGACCPDACGSGVVSAGFAAPIDTGCSSCSGASTITSPGNGVVQPPYQTPSSADFGGGLAPTPAPSLPLDANVPSNRVNRPVSPGSSTDGESSVVEPPTTGVKDDATSYWDAPQLFDARDRSAARPAPNRPRANVWPAVYQQPATQPTPRGYRQTAYRPEAPQRPARHKQVGASGWRSAD